MAKTKRADQYIAVTTAQAEFMRGRVAELLSYSDTSSRPLIDLLANAYLFGLEDAVEFRALKDSSHAN